MGHGSRAKDSLETFQGLASLLGKHLGFEEQAGDDPNILFKFECGDSCSHNRCGDAGWTSGSVE